MITTDLSVLRKKNEDATLEESRSIIKLLELELKNSKVPGVGLAAPQIGINKKVAIIRIESSQEFLDLVNPKIIDKRNPYISENEACLSLPDTKINTQRYKEIVVVDDLHPEGFVAVGFVATVIEHEVDHLESVLITDRAIGKYKVGRNDACPCGRIENNKVVKFKNCHGR